MAQNVNLDALIVREDFEIRGEHNPNISLNSTLDLNKLRHGEFFYSVLRKPDFQRETNEWSVGMIEELIESFLEGDLIPSVILWKNGDNVIFVLDGAHRLSALIAWVCDDYGDGEISRKFYNNVIPEEQIKMAQKARNKVKKAIGTYKEHCEALMYPDRYNNNIVKRARALGSLALDLQWVRGDASKAERAYFKINQKSCKINTIEMKILLSRETPNAIAARAIIRAGNGHKYWSKFSTLTQAKIEEIAMEINHILFEPQVAIGKMTTLELPMGGTNYSNAALAVVFNSINVIVDEETDVTDEDGEMTVDVLRRCKKVLEIVNSNMNYSLGLHPALYFYSIRTGGYQISCFMAMLEFVLYLEKENLFMEFTKVREKFEELIIEYYYFIEQIITKYGSGPRSYKHISKLYQRALELIMQDNDIDNVAKEIAHSEGFEYIRYEKIEVGKRGLNFSKIDKNQVFIKQAIEVTMKCPICGGYIHRNAISCDHITRKCEGGVGIVANGQITHPYCNCFYKH